MKLLGNRLLVSKVDETQKEGFQTVEVQDSFLYKGKIEAIGDGCEAYPASSWTGSAIAVINPPFNVGDVVTFAKYSPHTQTLPIDGKDMKIIRTEDVLAVV